MDQDKEREKSGVGATAGVISAIGTMLLPFALIYFGHIYKESEEKQGIHEKYVQMAVEILKAESSNENRELRAWAIEVLHEYSEVPIHVEAKEFLRNNSVKLNDENELPNQ